LGWFLRWVEDVQDGVHLHFEDDQILKADMVLVCTGVKPNIEFLKDTEIEIDQGILVDDHMQTSVNDIYAAGDVSQGMNPVRNFSSVRVDTDGALNPAAKQRGTLSNGVNQLSGKRERIGLWGNACYQGRTAGLNMAGLDTSYPGFLQQHIAAFFGLTFVHLGDINPQDKEIETLENFNHSEFTFRLLVFDRGVLIGANLINCHEEAGWLKTDMIRAMAQLKNRDRYIFYPSGKEVEVTKPIFHSFVH
jgi:NAD(P)H-nitrite reductase large subunit